ncbi:MAG TPA: glycosyltransferase family 4 protein [Burkholderiales bacterium]|nr:glycosyltransferase family 4 protein [Burkholderiales bacterium]
MKPISLALIRRRYAVDGGAERFIARALEALKLQNVRMTLVTRKWRHTEGVDVVVVNPFHIGRLWRNWSFARAIKKMLRQRRFDIVQSHERIAGCDIYRAGDGVHREWLRQRWRVLSAWRRLLQALSPYHAYIKYAEREMFESPALKAVICNSTMVKHELQQWFGLAEDKLHVIYNGVDLTEFHPSLCSHREAIRARHGIPTDATLFLFVGSGFERKGVAILIEAMAALPQVYLIVAGRDEKLSRYKRHARKLGIGNRVVFAGVQSDVKTYYGAADAVVLLTLYDPFPNVALEAMASGLPVITSTKSGAAEIIESGRNGFVCDALDRDALVAAMRSLTDRAFAQALGRTARATVESFGLDRMARDLVLLYEKIAPIAASKKSI